MGQMYLFRNKILVARSSEDIMFFEREFDDNLEMERWKMYH